MNEQPPMRQLTKVEAYVEEVLPKHSRVLLTLPAGIDPERFKNSLQIAIMMQPELLRCEPRLVFKEVSRVANHGLSLDPALGEAWLILRKNKDGVKEPQAQLGYRGKLRLARQSGEVARIAAYPVTEKSVAEGRFKVTLQAIHYEPDVFNDDTPVVGYFAFVLYKDGTEDYETMSVREIHKIRDRSDGWRAFKGNKIRSTPWSEFEGEMARKTVLNRLLKRVPMSANVIEFLREDDAADYTEVAEEDAQPAKPRQTRADTLRAIASQSDETEAPKTRRSQKEKSPPLSDLPENESETDDEQAAIDPDESFEELPAEEVTPIDRKSLDYKAGAADFGEGLRRCLHADIRADPTRFENWKAGWQEAKEADEAENGREDT